MKKYVFQVTLTLLSWSNNAMVFSLLDFNFMRENKLISLILSSSWAIGVC